MGQMQFFKKEKTIAFAVCPHLLRIFQFQLKKISVNQEFMQNHGMDFGNVFRYTFEVFLF
jgi:CO dehydrogenase/acetyl-CoA synthase epsilon subunit